MCLLLWHTTKKRGDTKYDQFTGKSELVHITRGASQLDSILAAARLGLVNIAPLPVTEQVRNGMKIAFGRK